MYSGDESQKAAIESWRSGAVDFIEKRLSPDDTKRKINLSLKKYAESSEIFNTAPSSSYRESIESIGLSGGSPEMAKISDYIKRAANTDACVLITGESGVGKEEVAKASIALIGMRFADINPLISDFLMVTKTSLANPKNSSENRIESHAI